LQRKWARRDLNYKMKKLIQQGAEAEIILKGNEIIKSRVPKSYRIKEIDEKLRKSRTKSETKLLIKASKIIDVPVPEETKEKFEIILPFIRGKKLSDALDSFNLGKQREICRKIGEEIAKLHKEKIIHGDLTTSNMILVENGKENFKIFFIDFGLGYNNGKYENKAVDIHLLKQALEAKHFKNWEILFEEFIRGYSSINKTEAEKVLERLKLVEKRGRYKY